MIPLIVASLNHGVDARPQDLSQHHFFPVLSMYCVKQFHSTLLITDTISTPVKGRFSQFEILMVTLNRLSEKPQ